MPTVPCSWAGTTLAFGQSLVRLRGEERAPACRGDGAGDELAETGTRRLGAGQEIVALTAHVSDVGMVLVFRALLRHRPGGAGLSGLGQERQANQRGGPHQDSAPCPRVRLISHSSLPPSHVFWPPVFANLDEPPGRTQGI